MNRRQILLAVLVAGVGASFSCSGRILAQEGGAKVSPADAVTIYLHPATGADSNSGAKDSPLRTLAAAARRVNGSTGTATTTIILSEGVYAVGETAEFKPTNRSFTKDSRLTIRAEVLPDDPDWHPGRMPTLIHTMPLSPTWNGRPDPFGGVAYGMQIETSHVTIQGLKILGIPVVEHPKPGIIHRVYPIGRNGRDLDDLEIKQCLFAGDEVTNPNHLGILANGTGIVVDHCIFYNLKQPVVYWSGGGPALHFRDIDPAFLELVGTKMSDQPLTLELDQTKRSYLHPIEGSEAARIGAGLFTK